MVAVSAIRRVSCCAKIGVGLNLYQSIHQGYEILVVSPNHCMFLISAYIAVNLSLLAESEEVGNVGDIQIFLHKSKMQRLRRYAKRKSARSLLIWQAREAYALLQELQMSFLGN